MELSSSRKQAWSSQFLTLNHTQGYSLNQQDLIHLSVSQGQKAQEKMLAYLSEIHDCNFMKFQLLFLAQLSLQVGQLWFLLQIKEIFLFQDALRGLCDWEAGGATFWLILNSIHFFFQSLNPDTKIRADLSLNASSVNKPWLALSLIFQTS